MTLHFLPTSPGERALRISPFVARAMHAHYVERIGHALGGASLLDWQVHGDALELFSNDYLGITREPALRAAQAAALQGQRGQALMSSALLGQDSRQRRLEAQLARFLDSEAVVLTQSGWAANVGLLQVIAAPGSPVYLDRLAR